ncbi:O-methyltransferase [Burkholderia pseudomallei]|uniref:O-methyltransferase n=1 Tax=Burkholderia pseudomallei TaxID=28450 RepID=UPI000530CB69|nr:O-methyltransferase [Burkholderia pseudomallei]ALJ73345.1 Putative O-methyltransferase [Burkholderia pseudomallei]ARK95280.1 methyltransferase [Burkholderia pseudomallei]KGS56334.1 putative O-methyltransferase [Burkholderia pseudomallei MSHR5609]KGS76336.1 putative O-methyltransferase [Burkholderia pseudomallei MSHR5596]KIX67369.1 methyltransferase [Burkholderia pseudomallei]
MNERQWSAVDDFFCSQLAPSDPVLDAALASSRAAGLPAINVTANQGKFLNLLATIRGARRILELGTLGGYSAIWLARALPPGGVLITLEANADHAALARENLGRAGLGGVASVVVGRAKDSLERLIAERAEPFDLIFLDADKDNYPAYLPLMVALSRPGTVIVADNVVRQGRVADRRNQDPDALGVREYFRLIAAHPRLTTTALQTVGSKGWDGFALTIVTA